MIYNIVGIAYPFLCALCLCIPNAHHAAYRHYCIKTGFSHTRLLLLKKVFIQASPDDDYLHRNMLKFYSIIFHMRKLINPYGTTP